MAAYETRLHARRRCPAGDPVVRQRWHESIGGHQLTPPRAGRIWPVIADFVWGFVNWAENQVRAAMPHILALAAD